MIQSECSQDDRASFDYLTKASCMCDLHEAFLCMAISLESYPHLCECSRHSYMKCSSFGVIFLLLFEISLRRRVSTSKHHESSSVPIHCTKEKWFEVSSRTRDVRVKLPILECGVCGYPLYSQVKVACSAAN